MSYDNFLKNFENIFEKTISIAILAEKNRPFDNKKNLIKIFLNTFENLDLDSKKKNY